jgi:hypothetical protein
MKILEIVRKIMVLTTANITHLAADSAYEAFSARFLVLVPASVLKRLHFPLLRELDPGLRFQ